MYICDPSSRGAPSIWVYAFRAKIHWRNRRGAILGAPIYEKERHLTRIAKVGALSAPMIEAMDLDDVFDGRIFCLMDYVSAIDGGELDVPTSQAPHNEERRFRDLGRMGM